MVEDRHTNAGRIVACGRLNIGNAGFVELFLVFNIGGMFGWEIHTWRE